MNLCAELENTIALTLNDQERRQNPHLQELFFIPLSRCYLSSFCGLLFLFQYMSIGLLLGDEQVTPTFCQASAK